MWTVPLIPARTARYAQGCGDRFAPDHAARGHDQAGKCRHLCLAAVGLRALDKVNAIIRDEQNRAGAIELLMPTIQSADLWARKRPLRCVRQGNAGIADRHEREMLFGPTNEEMITDIFRTYVKSYRGLPLNLYHLQWKFRDEVRPRFGVMRSREFLMKDAYSSISTRRGRGILQQDVRRLPSDVRPLRVESHPDAGRHRFDRRRTQPRVHHPR